MKQGPTYATLGGSALAFVSAVDTALGIGGTQWLADLCLTDSSMSETEMAAMSVEISPMPLLALSVILAVGGLWMLLRDDKAASLGLSKPDMSEQASIVSAIVLAARSRGETTRDEIRSVFEIVTKHRLDFEVSEAAYDICQRSQPWSRGQKTLPPIEDALTRRRVLAAVLMVGCMGEGASPLAGDLAEQVAFDIGVTTADIQAARQSVTEWRDTLQNEPPRQFSLHRHRSLILRPV